jgi:hypothetical protein
MVRGERERAGAGTGAGAERAWGRAQGRGTPQRSGAAGQAAVAGVARVAALCVAAWGVMAAGGAAGGSTRACGAPGGTLGERLGGVLGGVSVGAAQRRVGLAAEREVAAALASLGPAVQDCAARSGARPGEALQVHAYLFPGGEWLAHVGARSDDYGTLGRSPLSRCVEDALRARIGSQTRSFRGSKPRVVTRTFRVAATRAARATAPTPETGGEIVLTPAPAPGSTPASTTARGAAGQGATGQGAAGQAAAGQAAAGADAQALAALRGGIAARRDALQACFPHGALSVVTTVRLRLEVRADGAVRLSGYALPGHLDGREIRPCVERALAGLEAPAGAAVRSLEVSLSVRADPPPHAPPNPLPPRDATPLSTYE